jgi:hypothetical protein
MSVKVKQKREAPIIQILKNPYRLFSFLSNNKEGVQKV